MKELVILSGKGGTGKTSITAAFAGLAGRMVLCDADVDAADLHLILNPEVLETHDFIGGNEAHIDAERCTQCGRCIEVCRFGAISDVPEIDPVECEGCGVCVDLCPEQAIEFPPAVSGQWFRSETRFGPMIHARLGIAQENSGKLVAQVRQEAKKTAEKQKIDLIITDGPPGVGCPVIASVGQASAVLIVAEPTVSGHHDMERVWRLAEHFNIPSMVCINKFDLNIEQADKIDDFARQKNIPIAGRIPFDADFVQAMIRGETIFEYDKASQAAASVKSVWDKVFSNLSTQASAVTGILQHI